jgi:hypothetical protein
LASEQGLGSMDFVNSIRKVNYLQNKKRYTSNYRCNLLVLIGGTLSVPEQKVSGAGSVSDYVLDLT